MEGIKVEDIVVVRWQTGFYVVESIHPSVSVGHSEYTPIEVRRIATRNGIPRRNRATQRVRMDSCKTLEQLNEILLPLAVKR